MLPHHCGGEMLLFKKKKKGSRPDEATLRVERGNSTELTSFLFLVCLYFLLVLWKAVLSWFRFIHTLDLRDPEALTELGHHS